MKTGGEADTDTAAAAKIPSEAPASPAVPQPAAVPAPRHGRPFRRVTADPVRLPLTRDTAPKAPMDMVTRGCSLRLCSRSVHSISRSTSSGRSGITASFRISAPEDASSAKISDSSAASGVRSK